MICVDLEGTLVCNNIFRFVVSFHMIGFSFYSNVWLDLFRFYCIHFRLLFLKKCSGFDWYFIDVIVSFLIFRYERPVANLFYPQFVHFEMKKKLKISWEESINSELSQILLCKHSSHLILSHPSYFSAISEHCFLRHLYSRCISALSSLHKPHDVPRMKNTLNNEYCFLANWIIDLGIKEGNSLQMGFKQWTSVNVIKHNCGLTVWKYGRCTKDNVVWILCKETFLSFHSTQCKYHSLHFHKMLA